MSLHLHIALTITGVPLKDVMVISGLKRLITLENHIKSTREDSVQRPCKNELFGNSVCLNFFRHNS